jgi:hypothetical protein
MTLTGFKVTDTLGQELSGTNSCRRFADLRVKILLMCDSGWLFETGV